MTTLLDLLELEPSAASTDYVENRRQFHLFGLLTEQRHPKTWNLSYVLDTDTERGLGQLLSVDEDITAKLGELAHEPELLEQAAAAMAEAVWSGRRIYVYGCGATGRLAKQIESQFWRPFWQAMRRHPGWDRLRAQVGEDIEERLTGEMTGADRALVSSLEGFEDLQLIGRLQLEDHCIRRGDVVICVTEGGETSSVIGTILAALDQYGPLDDVTRREARRHLYFLCNNPVPRLLPFARSAAVLEQPAITHIDLTTGPQGITGSTRMQATTIETFVVGVILEDALSRILERALGAEELGALGFSQPFSLTERLREFEAVRRAVADALASIAAFTELEAHTYRRQRFATYLADRALITVFIDGTERSPTFRLYPLDSVAEPRRRCWIQVWTDAPDQRSAWHKFLGRAFRGLSPAHYRPAFESQVADPYLREAALRSLQNAGDDQELHYDFSFAAPNIGSRGPGPGDLGVVVLMEEEARLLEDPGSAARRFMDLFHRNQAAIALVTVGAGNPRVGYRESIAPLIGPGDLWVPVALDPAGDPLGLRGQIALKMLLNAHSTAVMASLGRVVGNTMTGVSPSNLKLIGRAAFLIRSHVNDVLGSREWNVRHPDTAPISFAEACAVLFDAIEYVRRQTMAQTAEVALSIVRIIAALDQQRRVGWEEARELLDAEGLPGFLLRHNPALARS